MTDCILRDKRTAKQHTGYSELAVITDSVTPLINAVPTVTTGCRKATAPDWLWSENRQLKQACMNSACCEPVLQSTTGQ